MDIPSSRGGARRVVAARRAPWAMPIARALARAGIRPNLISAASVIFAGAAGACFAASAGATGWRGAAWLAAAAVGIQLRLLCNLFDGMVAVECGLKTRSGEIFNDLPDRLADPAILIGVGCAARAIPHGMELGWLAALLAVLTAYVRVLSGAAGAPQRFLGPMAKQHRMALLTVAALLGAAWRAHAPWIMAGALVVVAVGCAVTVARRVAAAVRDLEDAP